MFAHQFKKPLLVMSKCTFTLDYGDRPCTAKLMEDGTIQGESCGDACEWICQKSGVGNPPFHWKKRLYVGENLVPNREEEDA